MAVLSLLPRSLRICGGVVQDAGGAGRKGIPPLSGLAHVLIPREAGGGSWQQFFGFIAQDGFGEYRPVRELAADVVFREGIAPKAYRRGDLRRVLDSAGDELAGDLRATAGPGALVSCCQGGDAAGHDLTAGVEDGREGGGSEAVRWRLDVPSGQQVRDDRVDGAACLLSPLEGMGRAASVRVGDHVIGVAAGGFDQCPVDVAAPGGGARIVEGSLARMVTVGSASGRPAPVGMMVLRSSGNRSLQSWSSLASARRVSSAGTGLAPVPEAKSLRGTASRPSRCGRLRLAPGAASGS